MRISLIFLLSLFMAGLSTSGFSKPPQYPHLHLVAVDPLLKVFRDSHIGADDISTVTESARGEHATFQVVVTSSPVDMKDLHCEVTTFTSTAVSTGTIQLPAASVRYVGYIGSSFTAPKPAQDQLRRAPAVFPDPLLEDESVDVHAGDNQPVWVSIEIPKDVMPGDYAATATVAAKIFGVETTSTIPLALKVYPAVLGHPRLNVTTWFQMWQRGDLPMPEKYSPEWWAVLRTYVRDLVAHHQNWARVETLWLVKYSRDASGELQFDFSNFDRWVNILFDEGVEKVESLQFAWRGGKWKDPYVVETHDEHDKDYKGTRVAPDSPEAIKFYSNFFPKFRAHLVEKGWLDKFVQHVGDEPVAENADSYTTASNLLKKYAPGIPVMEACLAHNMIGAIDIWVPTLSQLHQSYAFFKDRMKAGDKVWYYNCVQPQGEYANRFVELPLIKTRLMYWINYRYGIAGYLHWGYNFWRAHPWDNLADGHSLPGGDMAIVYPAKKGYGIISSIRWEAERDGIEDHELLSQLGDKDPAAAMNLAKKEILDFDKYNTDIQAFRATRYKLLEALSNVQSGSDSGETSGTVK